jgi:hypothetical protein
MLLIRCAACKRKLWKYVKYGQGDVLRCHKDRISKIYDFFEEAGKLYCLCGKEIGIDKGTYYKMIAKSFVYKGKKVNR